MGLDGNLCEGLFYEHRFAVLINTTTTTSGVAGDEFWNKVTPSLTVWDSLL